MSAWHASMLAGDARYGVAPYSTPSQHGIFVLETRAQVCVGDARVRSPVPPCRAVRWCACSAAPPASCCLHLQRSNNFSPCPRRGPVISRAPGYARVAFYARSRRVLTPTRDARYSVLTIASCPVRPCVFGERCRFLTCTPQPGAPWSGPGVQQRGCRMPSDVHSRYQ